MSQCIVLAAAEQGDLKGFIHHHRVADALDKVARSSGLGGEDLAIEPGIYWEGGGGLRLEDNFLVTHGGCEKLCSYPDDFRR